MPTVTTRASSGQRDFPSAVAPTSVKVNGVTNANYVFTQGEVIFNTGLAQNDEVEIVFTYPTNGVDGAGGGSSVTAATAAQVKAGTDTTTFVSPKTLADASITQALTDAATILWDTALGSVATVGIGASRILAAPTNAKAGQVYVLFVNHNVANSTLSYSGGFNFGAAGAPTLSTGSGVGDMLTFVYLSGTFVFVGITKGY